MTTRDRRMERGESNLGCLVWVIILAITGTVLWKAVPVKMASAALEDYMVEQAKFAVRASPGQIHGRLYKKAMELGIPVTKKQIKVQKNTARVHMQADYTVRLDEREEGALQHALDEARPAQLIRCLRELDLTGDQGSDDAECAGGEGDELEHYLMTMSS